MQIEDLMNEIEYCLRYYVNEKTGKRLNILEYYALTDMTPYELSRIVSIKGKRSVAERLRRFEEENNWLLRPANIEAKLRVSLVIGGYELTSEDKLSIFEKIQSEGFPMQEGVYLFAARYYVNYGIDSISKEDIRTDVKKACGKHKEKTNAPVLAKTM